MKVALVTLALLGAVLAQNPADQQAQIISQDAEVNPDGSYRNSFQTSNGISAREQGQLKNANNPEQAAIEAQGDFQYTAPDGTPIQVQYVADENGYRPQGAHLPVPPENPHPIPPAIQRALDWIQANEPQKPQKAGF